MENINIEKMHRYISAIRPFIKAKKVEIKAGIPGNALTKHYHFVDGKKHGQRLSGKNTKKVFKALAEIFAQNEEVNEPQK